MRHDYSKINEREGADYSGSGPILGTPCPRFSVELELFFRHLRRQVLTFQFLVNSNFFSGHGRLV